MGADTPVFQSQIAFYVFLLAPMTPSWLRTQHGPYVHSWSYLWDNRCVRACIYIFTAAKQALC